MLGFSYLRMIPGRVPTKYGIIGTQRWPRIAKNDTKNSKKFSANQPRAAPKSDGAISSLFH